jgi:tRNA-dihydrouridine synthase B
MMSSPEADHVMHIGSYTVDPAIALAPMAGVTDPPFRRLCRHLGAGLAVSEMISANPRLRDTLKTHLRMQHQDEPELRVVQIVGADPGELADAARFNVDRGAQVIDINMGCPAKKVCSRMAGSALLQDERLVRQILETVVSAVAVPVTLKIRTGPHPQLRNAAQIARMAQESGIQALSIHGRTRADAFRGQAEYETIARVKASVDLPVIANGDIDSVEKAKWVKEYTGADGIMLGRAAQGRPWIFREIAHYLGCGRRLPGPSPREFRAILLGHLEALYAFYGERIGPRVARKHIGWYLKGGAVDQGTLGRALRAESPDEQTQLVEELLTQYRLVSAQNAA